MNTKINIEVIYTKSNIEVIYTKSNIEVLCNKLKMGTDSTEFHSYMLLGKIFDPLNRH